MQVRKPTLLKEIIKNVSRSFYLTLKALPKGFRTPASLAYLIARASDTIADTQGIEKNSRKEMLELWKNGMEQPETRNTLLHKLSAFLTLSATQIPPKEAILLEKLPKIFEAVAQLPSWQQKLIWQVNQHISTGQLWDTSFFRDEAEIKTLENEEILWNYTYQVAGCVGEFWTHLGYGLNSKFSSLPLEKMLQLGKNYGNALQLINILRDLPEDLERNRCYIPMKEACSEQNILKHFAYWHKKAELGLTDGLLYAKSLPRGRLRYATALPALIGKETLTALDKPSWQKLQNGVKISREKVRLCLWLGFWL